jgi:hypothetical protein
MNTVTLPLAAARVLGAARASGCGSSVASTGRAASVTCYQPPQEEW